MRSKRLAYSLRTYRCRYSKDLLNCVRVNINFQSHLLPSLNPELHICKQNIILEHVEEKLNMLTPTENNEASNMKGYVVFTLREKNHFSNREITPYVHQDNC